MLKILAYVRKNLVLFIPMVMLMGLVTGYLYDVAFLREFILPLTILMVFPMMVTLNIKSFLMDVTIVWKQSPKVSILF